LQASLPIGSINANIKWLWQQPLMTWLMADEALPK